MPAFTTRAFGVLVALALPLTACSGGDDDSSPEPAAASGTTAAPPPTLADRFYPPAAATERIRLGNDEFVSPCRLLPPDEVRKIFGAGAESGVDDEVATRSLAPGFGIEEATCRHSLSPLSFKITVGFADALRVTRSNVRRSARPTSDGIWLYVDDRRGAFDDAIEELGIDPTIAQATYRIQDGRTWVELQLDLREGESAQGRLPAVRRAFANIRPRLADRGSLEQTTIGPVLHGKPVTRGGTTIADACTLLSPQVLTGLTGSEAYNLMKTNSTAQWFQRRTTNPDGKKWASPYTACEWGTGRDKDQDAAAEEYRIELMVRSHPDVAEATRSMNASLSRYGVADSMLLRPSKISVDAGGWLSLTSPIVLQRLTVRVGRYVLELDVSTGDDAVIRTTDEMDEAVAAVVDQLRQLGS